MKGKQEKWYTKLIGNSIKRIKIVELGNKSIALAIDPLVKQKKSMF
jgi:hypothetical protein